MQCIPPKKQSATFPIRFSVAVFLSALIFGCAQNARYYFYEGNPRPSNEVATMVLDRALMLTHFDRIPMAKFSKTYDIPAGEHRLDFHYSQSSTTYGRTTTYSGQSHITFKATAGHVYYFYPESLPYNKWRLQVAEFAHSKDFADFQQGFTSDLIDGNAIKQKAERHFKTKQTHSLRVSAENKWE